MTFTRSAVLLITCFVLASGGLPIGEEPLRLVQTIPLPGVEGRIDHLAVDAGAGRLYLAALGNNTVEVLDLNAGTHLKSLSGFREPQGIAVAPDRALVAVANGEGDGLDVLDARSGDRRRSVRLGDDSDNVRWDAKAARFYVGFGSGALAAIDPDSGNIVGQVHLPAHPESFQLDPAGPRIFVNLPDAGQIDVVDRVTLRVVATWPVTAARANYPMALDADHQRLFVGCRKPATVLVYDISTGTKTGAFSSVGDTDDLFYDAARGRLLVTGGEGFVDVFQVDAGTPATRIARVATAGGARTSLFVPAQSRLYVAVPHRGGQRAEVRVFESR